VLAVHPIKDLIDFDLFSRNRKEEDDGQNLQSSLLSRKWILFLTLWAINLHFVPEILSLFASQRIFRLRIIFEPLLVGKRLDSRDSLMEK
jgi:hypothetical protein